MAARRCTTCAVNYLPNVHRCPQCGDQTWYAGNLTPDPVAQGEGDEYELGSVDALVYDPAVDAKIVDWRASCLERAGFSELEASVLAIRRDVDREQVERMLRGGATAEQVRAIVL